MQRFFFSSLIATTAQSDLASSQPTTSCDQQLLTRQHGVWHEMWHGVWKGVWNGVWAIGNFDGCHLGHQQLLQRLHDPVPSFGTAPPHQPGPRGIITFHPHPALFFKRKSDPILIMSKSVQTTAFARYGVDVVIDINFDTDFIRLGAEEFVKKYLIQLKPAKLVVGANFRFGHQRSGDAQQLRQLMQAHHCQVEIIPLYHEAITGKSQHAASDERYSSSCLRKVLRQGDLARFHQLAGHAFELHAKIVSGDQLARKLGFPTLNLAIDPDQLYPKAGIYLARASLQRSVNLLPAPAPSWPALLYLGTRPTIAGKSALRCEVHVLDRQLPMQHNSDVRVVVQVLQQLRDDQKFTSLAELEAAIQADVSAAKKWWGQHQA